MKIAVDVKFLFNSGTGIAGFTANLLEDLLGQPETGHEFYLLVPGQVEIKRRWSGRVEQIHVPAFAWIKKGRFVVYDQVSELIALNKLKPDVLFSPYYDVPVLYRRPCILTIHDLTMSRYSHLYRPAFGKYYEFLLRNAIGRGGCIVTLTQTTRQEIISKFSYPPDRVILFSHRLKEEFREISIDDSTRGRIRDRYNLPSQYILYSGGTDPRKNLENLFGGYAILRQIHRDTPPLVLIGKDTRVFWDLASKADIKNAQNCIYTPGYIQEADLPTLYSLSLLTVYPSSYEGFGFPLLESMASGRVVCCSDIPVFREIGGDVPVYFDQTNVEDIAQKLLATLTDTHDREDRALAGRTRARAYVDVSNRATFLKIVNSNHV